MSHFKVFENSEVISQHLIIKLDLGPALKCARGHDSIEDSRIVKSGVVDPEKSKWSSSHFGMGAFARKHSRKKRGQEQYLFRECFLGTVPKSIREPPFG